MEVKIISTKLFIFSIIIAVVFISTKALMQISNNGLQLTTCNEQGHLEIYLRYRDIDLLINPSSIKNVTYCISKSMPFYDRTIEYVVNPSDKLKNEILSRYKVINFLNNNLLSIGGYSLEVSKDKVVLRNGYSNIHIYKRQINSPVTLFSMKPSKLLSIIRPKSSVITEDLLRKITFNQTVLKNGGYMVYEY